MTNVREENHIVLTKLDSKLEQLSERFHGMGQTFQPHAVSVHMEVLRLQSVFQSQPPPVEASTLAALQERQVLFEQRMQDSVSQQLLQLRWEMSQSPPPQVVQELVSHMQSQAKEIQQLRQCLKGLVHEKPQARWGGCPPTSSSVSGLKFVDTLIPLQPSVCILGFVGEKYVSPPSRRMCVH